MALPEEKSEGRSDGRFVTAPIASPRPLYRWLYFLVMNLFSAGIAVGVFLFVYYADFLDSGSRSTANWFFDHPGVASVAAATPMLVTILIGLHYARRGARRRALAKAREVEAAGAAHSGGE